MTSVTVVKIIAVIHYAQNSGDYAIVKNTIEEYEELGDDITS
jgi:hypothetical protein